MHNSGIRGTQEVGIPTYTHAQRKEVCVADSDEDRVIKSRKLR